MQEDYEFHASLGYILKTLFQKKKKKIKFGFLLAVGGAFIVLAVVMIIVYYCI